MGIRLGDRRPEQTGCGFSIALKTPKILPLYIYTHYVHLNIFRGENFRANYILTFDKILYFIVALKNTWNCQAFPCIPRNVAELIPLEFFLKY